MIVVSGTGRSGTSMWLQILSAGGLDVLGERFPRDWESRLAPANPGGFFESTLVEGINFTTNPNPETGARLVPATSRHLGVKIFNRGVGRTERPFLDRVLVSVRHPLGFLESVQRMVAMERESGLDVPELSDVDPVRWWLAEHLTLLMDAQRRGYALRLVSYEGVRATPAAHIPPVLAWLGLDEPLDAEAAVAAVAPRPLPPPPELDLPGARREAVEAVLTAAVEGKGPSAELVSQLLEVLSTWD